MVDLAEALNNIGILYVMMVQIKTQTGSETATLRQRVADLESEVALAEAQADQLRAQLAEFYNKNLIIILS